jgi:single-strand DNA-binding protein
MSAFAQISGRLGQAPELRHTHGGTAVVNLSVANNRTVKSGEGRKSVADWFKVTVYGRDAETIATHAKKGSALTFNGRLQTESYETREGQRRTDTILVADAFEFLPPGRKANPTLMTKISTSEVAVLLHLQGACGPHAQAPFFSPVRRA